MAFSFFTPDYARMMDDLGVPDSMGLPESDVDATDHAAAVDDAPTRRFGVKPASNVTSNAPAPARSLIRPIAPGAEATASASLAATSLEPLSSPDAEFELCGFFLRMGEDDLLLARRLLERVVDADMAHVVYRNILTAARALIEQGQPCSPISVLDYASMNRWDVGGAEHLGHMMADPVGALATESTLARDIEIITEHAQRRQIRARLQGLLSDLPTKRVVDLVQAFADEARALESSSRIERQEPVHISEPMMQVAEDLTNEEPSDPPVRLGFRDLDAALNGGGRDGELILVGARPGMGKTAFAMGVARNISMDTYLQERDVLVFSLEMSAKSLASRLLSAESAVPAQVLRRGNLDDSSFEAVSDVLPRFAGMDENHNVYSRLWIDDRAGLSMADISSTTRAFVREQRLLKGASHRAPVVMVDYMQIVNQGIRLAGGDGGGDNRAVGLVSQALKNLSRELGTPVIVLSQLNRNLELRANKRPVLSDLRESGSLEQDADIILFIYRDSIYNSDADPSAAEIIIAKQREGGIGIVPMAFNSTVVRFENWGHTPQSMRGAE